MPSDTPPFQRSSPRVILRTPLEGRFDGMSVLVVELGLGGAKFEHSQRVDIGRRGAFFCGDFEARASVRHSVMLPTADGVVFHVGIGFDIMERSEKAELMKLLLAEAQEQVAEWEANLSGEVFWKPQPSLRSAVSLRFLALHFTNAGWQRKPTSDPNHPLDGITVPGDTPEEELKILCDTFERGDDADRELLRRMATVTILERMRDK